MQIDPDELLEGMPIIRIRDALKRAPDGPRYYPEILAERLKISLPWARAIVNCLTEQGYLQLVSKRPKEWEKTPKGFALANASAAKPIHRATADRLLKEFMERVEEVNTNEHYLCKVVRVIVFGSYLSDKDRMSDLDIAIELERKLADFDKHQRLQRLRVKEARVRGRVFASWLDEQLWDEQECVLYLKSRSRGLSLHRWESNRQLIESGQYKVLFTEPPPE